MKGIFPKAIKNNGRPPRGEALLRACRRKAAGLFFLAAGCLFTALPYHNKQCESSTKTAAKIHRLSHKKTLEILYTFQGESLIITIAPKPERLKRPLKRGENTAAYRGGHVNAI